MSIESWSSLAGCVLIRAVDIDNSGLACRYCLIDGRLPRGFGLWVAEVCWEGAVVSVREEKLGRDLELRERDSGGNTRSHQRWKQIRNYIARGSAEGITGHISSSKWCG